MKTRLLITFIVVLPLVILIPQTSFSLLAAQTPEELYDSHHTIIKGKILDYTAISQRQTLYDVEVIEYLKNPQEDKTIQALGDGVKDAREGTSVDVIFDINDIVLLYLYHTDDSFTISHYSRMIIEEDFVNPHISPHEITPEVFDKTFSITQKQVKYVIPYKITSGTIDDMKLNCDSASLVLSISSSDAGILQLDVPQRMLGGIFMVLVDEVEWDEVSIDGNVLTVNFPENTSKIEVLGAYYISSDKYTGVCDVSHDPPYSYILSPLKQIKNGVALIDVQCKEGKIPAYKYNRMHVACVSEETHSKLITRGWALLRLGFPGSLSSDLSLALCNNYEGKWHPEYEGCRDVTDSQCSLMGGEFVDNLEICYNGICPEDKLYSLCITNPDLFIQYPGETQEDMSHRCGPSDTLRGQTPTPSVCKSENIYCIYICGDQHEWTFRDRHGFSITQETAKEIYENEN